MTWLCTGGCTGGASVARDGMPVDPLNHGGQNNDWRTLEYANDTRLSFIVVAEGSGT